MDDEQHDDEEEEGAGARAHAIEGAEAEREAVGAAPPQTTVQQLQVWVSVVGTSLKL